MFFHAQLRLQLLASRINYRLGDINLKLQFVRAILVFTSSELSMKNVL